jgi:hypothetical protein
VLPRFSEAESYFAAAADTASRLGASWAAACTALGWARRCLARSAAVDRERSMRLFNEAVTSASEHGHPTIERRARTGLDNAAAH